MNILDLGCGDGKQILRQALKNPSNTYIGIDSNSAGFFKTQKKINKEKIANLRLVNASAENLPSEFEAYFDEIQINFPWGSLLEGVVKADSNILTQIRKVARNEAKLVIYLTYGDSFEEKYKIDRNLPELNLAYIQNDLQKRYLENGIEISSSKILNEEELKEIDSPWGKKITSKRTRPVFLIQGIIAKKI